MKTIFIPADTEHLYLDEIAHLIADCQEPEGPSDPDSVKYWLTHIQVMGELGVAARNGVLNVRHPMGHGPFNMALGLQRAVVLPKDVAKELASRGITLELEADTQPEADAALVAALPAGEPRPAATGPQFTMKKAAMVEQHKHEWPTIERDMQDANRNGLDAAKAGAREWDEAKAMEWARSKGKLASIDKSAQSLTGAMNSMASLPTSRQHRLKG